MRHLYKKISLEPYKARIPNTIPSFKDGKELVPSEVTFLFDNPNGVFGALPSDIQIPEYILEQCEITDITSLNINLHRPQLMGDIGKVFKYYHIDSHNWSGNVVSVNEETEGHVYLSYQKLHKWYRFFVDYFNLLNSTTCLTSGGGSYDCAVTYYYNNNEINETLEYFQELDKTFIARGGKINDELKGTYCPLYDWMVDEIFMTFDIPPKFQNEWKVTKLNINSLFQWYSWFKVRFGLYGTYESSHKCVQALLDNDEETDCCDCKEYFRLGGNEMYYILKEYVNAYYDKAKNIANLATMTATINIPIQLQTSANVIGELTPFVEEWEGGVDYSNTSTHGLGTTIHYGGTTFLNEESNELITIEDNVFVSTKEDKGYIQNKYKELTFLKDGKPIYEEYMPTYISNDKESHEIYKVGCCEDCGYSGALKDVAISPRSSRHKVKPQGGDDYVWVCPDCGSKNIIINQNTTTLEKFGIPQEFKETYDFTAYSFAFNKLILDPSYKNMSLTIDIVVPDTNLHFYFIENKVYTSITANTVTIDEKHNIKLLVQYYNNDKANTPFIEYRGGKYYGYYDDEKKKFKFTFAKKPCKSSEWFDVDEEIYEYVLFKGKIYEVQDDLSVEIFNFDTRRYYPFYGYFDTNKLVLINKIENEYYLGVASNSIEEVDGKYIVVSKVDVKNDMVFGEKIANIEEWDEKDNDEKKLGYYFTDEEGQPTSPQEAPSKFNFIKPYTVNYLDTVTGYTRSKIESLSDVKIYYDKMGNEMEGSYYGTDFFPSDEDIFDLKYHIGNVSDLSYITRDNREVAKVYGNKSSDGMDYYWGNLISNITFFYIDKQGDRVFDETADGYIMASVDIPFKDKNECFEPFKENLSTIQQVEEWCDRYWEMKQQELEIFMENPFQLCCQITYNMGAIIMRPYCMNGTKYIYGQYQLSRYHKGVEYVEEYKVNMGTQKYYLEKTEFYDIKYYSLTPLNQITYYLDEIVTEDSEPYTANKAFFSVEINYNFTTASPNWTNPSNINSKFSTCLNSSEADGRQFNFYNGFMASPNIMQEYNLGISSLRNVKEDIYVDRGVSYAYDRHLKLLEVKSFEALEQYNNGFFNIKNQEN